jgi:hypothetical protein
MYVLCPVCDKEFEVNFLQRDDTIGRCPRCGLYAEVTTKKDKHGRIWKITLTEKPDRPGILGSPGMSTFLYIVWMIVVILLLIYVIYSYFSIRL